MSEISCSADFNCADLSYSPNNSDNLTAAGAGYDDASSMKNDQCLMMHLRSLTGYPQIVDCLNPPDRGHSCPTTSS